MLLPISRDLEIAWYDRTGQRISAVTSGNLARDRGAALAPDGKRIAFTAAAPAGNTLWLQEPGSSAPSQLPFAASTVDFPVWSSDGRWLFFSAGKNRAHDRLVRMDTATFSKTDIVVTGGTDLVASGVSPDGKTLLYRDVDPKEGHLIWTLTMD